MKKLVAFAAVVAAVSFASCSNKAAENTEAVAETEPVVEEAVAPVEEAAVADSTATEVAPGDSAAVEAAVALLFAFSLAEFASSIDLSIIVFLADHSLLILSTVVFAFIAESFAICAFVFAKSPCSLA